MFPQYDNIHSIIISNLDCLNVLIILGLYLFDIKFVAKFEDVLKVGKSGKGEGSKFFFLNWMSKTSISHYKVTFS